ncbi:NADPH-dependent 2,4-dienoyl-CoA reductase/sulfur reductase-like enzyme [Mycoplasmoides fastidiosum]|uniref:NADPH-dependent 2,4-dienoyl-CoA reductase/sulfur reductase-like enzyme n=1 Tax=Mycoplasmoides fastidiosum TaxID=92758 RepID=A0ABU0M047_9BACT|nr:FAD-dependent oxidoreductase [Mycoplasmoides fastidiosum]MDQ0514331.1 NADPH-dependent 2,4-dienoyl-CoA reductase/sulfur reductase-like enzyme [Mycoplasmoides fastidiosum]UUD38066.1 FAD-dependent oxidoreductase [Mycoplasmoides fastidiosum]
MNNKIVVVGVNHAGTSAIKTLLVENPNLQVVGIEKNDNTSFLGCGIALAVGGVVQDPTTLFYSNAAELESLGAKIHMKHQVVEVNYQQKFVVVKNLVDDSTFQESFDTLIYAGGSWPIIMPFHKPEYKGIKLCKSYAQALQLIEDAKTSDIKNVTILGAGYIGIELTEAFAHAGGKNVTLIDMENRIMPRYFDTEFTDQVEEKMRAEGINLVMSSKVVELLVDNDNNVTGLRAENCETKAITEVQADLVISCVGFFPQTSLLTNAVPNLLLSRNKAIAVNQYAQALDTNHQPVPGIYVIGDAAAAYYAPTKTHENVALATNAVKLGAVAASHINSQLNPVLGQIKLESIAGSNAICVFDFAYASTGLSHEGAKRLGLEVDSFFHEANDRCEFMNVYAPVRIKLVWEKNTMRLLGAQIGSPRKDSHAESIFVLALAIQKNMTIFDLLTLDFFFLPHLNKPLNFVLYSAIRALGLKFRDHNYLTKQ